MKYLLIAVLSTVSFAATGCGSKKKSPVQDWLDKTVAFKDAICKCNDTPCTNKVVEDMTKYNESLSKLPMSDRMPDPDQQKVLDQVQKEIMSCTMKAAQGGAAVGSAS